jgi:hypothetical protein
MLCWSDISVLSHFLPVSNLDMALFKQNEYYLLTNHMFTHGHHFLQNTWEATVSLEMSLLTLKTWLILGELRARKFYISLFLIHTKCRHWTWNVFFQTDICYYFSQCRCPYYISRELSKSVDILFAPYNYLIDPGNRRSLAGIPWDNAVLIFDEAHNLVGK